MMRKTAEELRQLTKPRIEPNAEISRINELRKLFNQQDKTISSELIGMAVRTVENTPNQNIFSVTGVERNSERTMSLIANLSRVSLQETIPSALNDSIQPRWEEMRNYVGFTIGMDEHELNILLDGYSEDSKQRQTHEIHSLGRHLVRSAILSKVFIEQMLEKQKIPSGKINFHNDEYIADPRLKKFGLTYLGGLHPFHHPVVMRHHDYVRRIDQKSSHDILIKPLVQEIGLIPAIQNSFHEPVPNDRPITDNYDNGAQMISRLADNFGKVEWIEGYGNRLRRSIEDMCEYSRERQTMYFQEEREIPGTYWYGKDRSNLEIYLTNEKIAYIKATDWLEVMTGKKFNELMASIDNNPSQYEIYTK